MNPLNIIRTIAGAAAVVVVGLTVKDSIQTTKTERVKREEIKLNTERELLAIRRAGMIVQEKIRAGEYDRDFSTAIPTIFSDLKFYQIIDRIES